MGQNILMLPNNLSLSQWKLFPDFIRLLYHLFLYYKAQKMSFEADIVSIYYENIGTKVRLVLAIRLSLMELRLQKLKIKQLSSKFMILLRFYSYFNTIFLFNKTFIWCQMIKKVFKKVFRTWNCYFEKL